MPILTSIYRSLVIITLGILFLFQASCATVQLGHDFDVQTFETRVVSGKSTRQDIKTWLGTPTSTGISVHADGKQTEKWTYYHGQGKLPGLKNARLKLLEVEFDNQGVVYSYTWSQ
jgi:hypothetical protein